ncbi:cell division protein FtsQ/DivIB [uncultured Oscillibacter sp.]|jgi:cell division protein FtsQ|uniref:cell division protein FtsQ/DivIB n=2 Tax=uncultured Oscillibacter sp. TaxID=876091 RepID=UPI002171842D|nr:FtsQ-type POTRA domain-containing protein [uncultured Oscillibacter sp.]MCI9460518.1 FtsQ-type POTRA domain-containing protein [Oscillibacter sp.]
MARRRQTKRRRRRGSFGFLYKLLSVLVICTAILAAMTLFFRVGSIVVTGQKRYTAEEIQAASGVELGSNMYLLNKFDVVRAITGELPYIEDIRINRKLPDTLLIEVRESGRPFALVQDGSAWLVSAGGKLVDQIPEREAGQYGRITGCQLLAPSVGTPLALATEYAAQQSSLLDLLAALDSAGLTENVDAIRLDDLSDLKMDYIGRFTVRMAYGADYGFELKKLTLTLEDEKIQSNMTGTIDLRLKSEDVFIIPGER